MYISNNNNRLDILDLPDEILLKIFNKLNMVDVFYSLVNVNQRFDRLVLDPLYVRNLDLTSMTIKSCFYRAFSINNHILDRFCQNILPRIHHQVNELIIEQHSITRVLHPINYPKLYSLSLIDFQDEALLKYLTGDAVLRALTQQITHLTIDIRQMTTHERPSENRSNIFALILSLFKRLIDLDFCDFNRYCPIILFNLPSTSCMSSTLTTLKMNVKNFDDCLYLLDGRLDSLLTLIIRVDCISSTLTTIDNMKKLPKLKHFSLSSIPPTTVYDNLVTPLLRQMINLEELILYLYIIRIDSNYIDGIQLYDNILIYMPNLNKFTFKIETDVSCRNKEIALSSNEDIQRSFIGRIYGQVDSHVESLPIEGRSRCRIHSLPYEFDSYFYLNNTFPGGMFNKVRFLLMIDSRPFESNFKVISQCFPFLVQLDIINVQPQKNKQQSSTPIIFPRLISLELASHADYAEQFLVDKNCHLPRLLNLGIRYESLAIATHNFTNDATRFTCAKLTTLEIDEPFVRPENFDQYFPLL